MIRDPSDGSVKGTNFTAEKVNADTAAIPVHPKDYGPNWGLKSLTQPERKPKPAPTAEELKQHYSKFGLRFQPKEQAE